MPILATVLNFIVNVNSKFIAKLVLLLITCRLAEYAFDSRHTYTYIYIYIYIYIIAYVFCK